MEYVVAAGSGPNGLWTPLDEKFHQLAISVADYNLRPEIFRSTDCPLWLLKGTLTQDTYFNVLEAAATNPKCPPEYLEIIQKRFSLPPPPALFAELNARASAETKLHAMKEMEESLLTSSLTDRDQFIRRHILSGDEKAEKSSRPLKNPRAEWTETDKFRVAMIMAPAWGKFFPPYGTAKLSALMRHEKYAVRVYDINAESAPYLQERHGINYWEANRYFVWESVDMFNEMLLPTLEPVFDEVIADILESKVKVVGFSIYNTNQNAVRHIAKKIRSLAPEICLLAGGPGATMTGDWWFHNLGDVFNYIFVGEAEEQLMHVLKNLPEKPPFNHRVGTINSRLDLEQYPFPDYTDFDLGLYEIRGVSLETSRGCVAKCSFCAETRFWKYRTKGPERAIEEIKHQIAKYGTTRFWFVDSLVNGDLKTFSRLLELIEENQISLKWNCYSRCNGKMNADFFRRIKKSGCTMLSFGIESGSQKVLDDMHKNVEVWEILQNMEDCHAAGIFIHSSWLQAFPTETPLDHLHSRQLIYACRKWIGGASLGMGAGITPNSDMDTNWSAYDMQWKRLSHDGSIHRGHSEDKFLGDWYTGGYRNTVLQRFLRVKLMNIWCHAMKRHCPETIIDFGSFYSDMDKFYSLEFKERRNVDRLKQNMHLDFRQGVGDDFAGLIVQDYLGFMYGLFEVYGAHEWSFSCEPEMDMKNFGSFLARRYWCEVKSKIDDDGNYTIHISHQLDHSDPMERSEGSKKLTMSGEVDYEAERKRENMSFKQQITLSGNVNNWLSESLQVLPSVHPQYAKRARMKPEHDAARS
jgi:anaerobic magnesium-protoporphyrin IX monomethyl ester cyclase